MSETTLHHIIRWNVDLLTQLKKQEYARYLRFTTINFPTLYEDAPALFEQPIWYTPAAPKTPVPLLTG